MSETTPSLEQAATFLDRLLEAPAYGAIRSRDGRGDQNGIYRASARPVKRMAFALEPWPDLERELAEGRIDAVFLHRPWRLAPEQQAALEAADAGVLAYHLSFDEHLTLGFNPPLATVLGMESPPEVLGLKEGRPLGMLARLVEPVTMAQIMARLREVFNGLETEHPGDSQTHQPVTKLAVVGAMTDALVRQAHVRGAELYVTGQWRQPATAAARETHMAVAAVGHLRSEAWGLRRLAGMVGEELGIEVVVPEAINFHA